MQTIRVTTVNGPVAILRRVYWANQHGCCAPLDTWLGLTQRYSQGVREMVTRLGLDSSYRKAAEDLRRLAQIGLSYQTFREVFQREGQKVRQAQRTEAYPGYFTLYAYLFLARSLTVCIVRGNKETHIQTERLAT